MSLEYLQCTMHTWPCKWVCQGSYRYTLKSRHFGYHFVVHVIFPILKNNIKLASSWILSKTQVYRKNPDTKKNLFLSQLRGWNKKLKHIPNSHAGSHWEKLYWCCGTFVSITNFTALSRISGATQSIISSASSEIMQR